MRANGQTLKLPEGRPALRSRSVELSGAPPLRRPVTIIWLGLAAVVLILFAVVTAWWAFVVS
jgi:hypothetical protein